MPLSLMQTVPPSSEPVSVAAVKAHLRIETTDEDGVIAELISAAREDVELSLRRQLLPATWVLGLDDWPCDANCPIRLPRPPLRSVTHIKYYDTSGTLQTFTAGGYQVDLLSEPARIVLTDGHTWPSLHSDRINAIQITYEAGYSNADRVPWGIRHMILLAIGDMYEHREARLDVGMGISRIEENPTFARLFWKFRLVDV